MSPFVKAERKQAKLRLAIDGPSGSGKTYTALIAASVMANGGKIAVIDTERNSASLYSDKFTFDVATLDDFAPAKYIELIHAAEETGYGVIVIDSLSHAWEGAGGVLDMHDAATKRQKTQNSYTAWGEVTPEHRALIDAMLQSKCHVIATMRSKMDYVQEKDDKTNRTVIRKVGMAPIQRQGTEYEFTIVGDMDVEHTLVISKSRCELVSDAVVKRPDAKFFKAILDWLNTGTNGNSAAQYQTAPTKLMTDRAAPTPAQPTQPAQSTRPAQPGNGNGKFDWTVDTASAVTTPHGLPLGQCTPEQLEQLAAKSSDPKRRSAAAYLREYLRQHETPAQPEAANA